MKTSTAVTNRLLRIVQADAAASITAHHALLGPLPTAPGQQQLLDEVARSGLLGRGGAGFPVAAKLGAVAATRGHRIVVGNGAESEPGSRKDALLLLRAPHLVLDGLVVAARAAGAHESHLVIHRGSPVLPTVAAALQSRADDIPTRLRELPHRYVASESSALLHHLAGGDAKPTWGPHAAATGSYVGNVETLAQLALLARHGAGWLSSVGERNESGTMLLTVTVPGRRAQVTEIELGTPVGDVIRDTGEDGSAIFAILIGGYGGQWWSVDDAWDLPLSHAGMRAVGADLGAGIVMALGHDVCPLTEIARVARWLDGQSAQQCGPCVRGLGAVAAAVTRLAEGRGEPGDDAGLERWQALVPGRGGCRHPDGAVRFVGSGLRVFARHAADHRRHGPCARVGAAPSLPVPPGGVGWR